MMTDPTYISISKVSERLYLPQHVLRCWQSQFQEIRPLIRAGGRRYYSEADVELIAGIEVLLRDQHLTIAGVRRVRAQHGTTHVRALGTGAPDRMNRESEVLDTVRRAFETAAANVIGRGVPEQILAEELVKVGIRRLRECASPTKINTHLMNASAECAPASPILSRRPACHVPPR